LDAAVSPSPLRIDAPLTLRLLRRILLVCVLSMLSFAGARAWWEYRAALDSSTRLMADIEQAMDSSLANSLWEFDVEHLESQLQGIRSTAAISYAAVLEHDRVVVESGARQAEDALTGTSELVAPTGRPSAACGQAAAPGGQWPGCVPRPWAWP
jgi:hypothetical protein